MSTFPSSCRFASISCYSKAIRFRLADAGKSVKTGGLLRSLCGGFVLSALLSSLSWALGTVIRAFWKPDSVPTDDSVRLALGVLRIDFVFGGETLVATFLGASGAEAILL